MLEWFLTPNGQKALIVHTSKQPLSPNQELWNLFFGNVPAAKQRDLRKLVLDTLYGKNMVSTMSYWPTWPDVERTMNRHLTNVYRGLESPTSAMTKAATEIRAIIKQ